MKVTLFKQDSRTGSESLTTLTAEALMGRIQSPTKADSKYVNGLRRIIPLLRGRKSHYEYIDRLPRVCPSLEWQRKGTDGKEVLRYNGIVLLEVNRLTGRGEAERVKAKARLFPQTLAAFVGSSGESVKIWVAFTLPDGTLPQLTGRGEAERVKAKARLFPQTLAAFVGSSGESVKIWVAFTLPDGTLPQQRDWYEKFHAHAYRLAVNCYQPLLPFSITLKEASPEISFRLTMDELAYYNPEVTPFRMEQPLTFPDEMTFREKRQQGDSPLARLEPDSDTLVSVHRLYEMTLAHTLQPLTFPDEMTFREKRQQGDSPLARLEPDSDTLVSVHRLYEMTLAHTLEGITGWKRGNDLQPLLVKLAEACFRSGIPEEETVRQTLAHYPETDEVTLRTLVHTLYQECKGFGESSSLSGDQAPLLRMKEFMERRYEFRFNTLTGETEYRKRDSIHFYFKPADRRARNSMAMDALEEGICVWDRDVDRYLGSDRIPIYNPIEDYLWSTGKWDGHDRIRELADCVPCMNGGCWRELFYRWFLSMVAHWRGMDRMHGNSTVPVLIGAQGYRKSTFCRLILPPELRFAYTDSLDFRSKRDAEMALGRFLLINLDEFDQISSNQQGFLKHLLQKPVLNLRKPYATSVQEVRRYASFIATSNHADLLNDPSGSRRFICIEVTEPIRTEITFNYRQLYAQAMQALNQGERYWLDDADEELLKQENRQFEQTTPLEAALCSMTRRARNEREGEEETLMEIAEQLNKRSRKQENRQFEQTTPLEAALCSMTRRARNEREGEEETLMEIAEQLNKRSRILKLKLTTGNISYLGRLMRKYGFTSRRTNRGMLYRIVWL